jgi:hypothetical protein
VRASCNFFGGHQKSYISPKESDTVDHEMSRSALHSSSVFLEKMAVNAIGKGNNASLEQIIKFRIEEFETGEMRKHNKG